MLAGGGRSHKRTILRGQFPDNQGKYREYSRFWTFWARCSLLIGSYHWSFSGIPYATEQGIFPGEQGIHSTEQGSFSRKRGCPFSRPSPPKDPAESRTPFEGPFRTSMWSRLPIAGCISGRGRHCWHLPMPASLSRASPSDVEDRNSSWSWHCFSQPEAVPAACPSMIPSRRTAEIRRFKSAWNRQEFCRRRTLEEGQAAQVVLV